MMDKRYQTNYRLKYKAGPIYRIDYYAVTDYHDNKLQLQGETNCGLAFILQVNEHKIMSIHVQKSLLDCFAYNPNFRLDLSHFNDMNQKLIYETCFEYSYLLFTHARHVPINQWQIELYERWKVEPKSDDRPRISPRNMPEKIKIIGTYI